MTQLIKYEAACRAVAECKAIDEVKSIHDKAEAMRVYAMVAGDKTMEVDAAEIRIRAERRLGEMLAEQKAAGELKPAATLKRGPVVVPNDHGEKRVKLSDAGISKDLSSRAQKMAAVPPAEFEAEVGEWRERVKAEGARVTTRLEKAGEKAIKAKPAAKKTPAQIQAEQIADDAHGDFDPLAELEAAHKEIQQLHALLAVAEADDLKAEALKWRRLHHDAERKQGELMQGAHNAQKHTVFLKRQLDRCGKAVGETDPDKIAPAVEAFVRSHTRKVA